MEAKRVLGDVPRIIGFVLFHKRQSVLLDDLPSSPRGLARRRGRDVQFYRIKKAFIFFTLKEGGGTPPAPPELNIIFYYLNHTRRIEIHRISG
ncbi:hypothetical protein D1BOALGB6SA_7072 [Olavius sp. associated proteobacterium Delta 1]|nr:hypothetical protein D1BOALGB6SA_7072 [Olavius sp. associated proteobacterium Delta 1]